MIYLSIIGFVMLGLVMPNLMVVTAEWDDVPIALNAYFGCAVGLICSGLLL